MNVIGGVDLEGTSVVVTGGARGIGLAMSRALATAGASVLIADIDDEPIQAVLTEALGDVHGLRTDVSSETDVNALVEQAKNLFGHLDVVVNNAGISLGTIEGGDSPQDACAFYEVGPKTLQRFFEVHVLGSFLVPREAVKGMVDQGFGRIVTITTSLDTMTRAKSAPYGPMKAASESFTSIMAHDLEGTGVTANVLIPGGGVLTRFASAARTRAPGSMLDAAIMGPPAVWLASRASDGVTAMRFSANRWDSSLPSAEAAQLAGAPIAWPSDRPPR